MKKLIGFLIVLMVLTGCNSTGKKNSEYVCTKKIEENDGALVKMTISHENDEVKVVKIEGEQKFSDADEAIESDEIEFGAEIMKGILKKLGVELDYEVKGDTLSLSITIDYEKVDFEKIASLLGEDFLLEEMNSETATEVVKNLEEEGFTCK